MHLSPTVLPWLTEHFASQPSLSQHHALNFSNSVPLQTLCPQWPTDPLPPQELFLPCLLHLGFQDVNLSLNDLEINRIEILLSSLPWPAILSFIDLLFQIGTSDIQIRLSWETDYQLPDCIKAVLDSLLLCSQVNSWWSLETSSAQKSSFLEA